MDALNRPPCEVVTFYSYKGGVGRSFALADVAVRLARWGHRVLVLDWDLEAPGLHQYFGLPPAHGVIDLVEALGRGEPAPGGLARTFQRPGLAVGIDVITAGRVGSEAYARQVADLDWSRLYADGFGRHLEAARQAWKSSYDFVLVDSRTGLSDSGGTSTILLPDILVAMFTANKQSVEGVLDAITRARDMQARLPVGRAGLMVVPVLTRVDFSEYEQQETWRRHVEASFGAFVEEWGGDDLDTAALLDALSVPYVPYWSFGERLPALEPRPSSKLDVGAAHEGVAALLAHRFESPMALVRSRHAYVAGAGADAPPLAPPRAAFLVYQTSDLRFARDLAEHLVAHGIPVVNPPIGTGLVNIFTDLPDGAVDFLVVPPRSRPDPSLRLKLDALVERMDRGSALESAGEAAPERVFRIIRAGADASQLPDRLKGAPGVPVGTPPGSSMDQLLRLLKA